MTHWLFNNFGLKILSVILAALVWWWIRTEIHPKPRLNPHWPVPALPAIPENP